jgi:nitrogen regulatory protein P-II 1
MTSFLVVLIVNEVEQCAPVLTAWEQAGVTGVTILESTGLGRVRRAGLRDDFPLMPSLSDLLQNDEIHHRTLFSVVETQLEVDQMIAAVRNVIGDLEEPHTGFLFVIPVLQVYGFGKHRTDRHLE